MPDERGLVSKSKLTALASAIKTKAEISGKKTLDELAEIVDDIGSHGLSAPYISASGTFTPTTDASSITIPLGVAISTPVLVEGHVINQENYLSSEYEMMALGFYAPFGKAIVPTNYGPNVAVFCVYMENLNDRSYYSGGVSISISGANLTISNSKGIIFKAGVPIRYLVIGYDGTDG